MIKRKYCCRQAAAVMTACLLMMSTCTARIQAESVTEGFEAAMDQSVTETSGASDVENHTEHPTEHTTEPTAWQTAESTTEHATEHATEQATEHTTEPVSEPESESEQTAVLSYGSAQLEVSIDEFRVSEESKSYEGDMVLMMNAHKVGELTAEHAVVSQTIEFPEGTILPEVTVEGNVVVSADGSTLAHTLTEDASIQSADTKGTTLTFTVSAEGENALDHTAMVICGDAIATETEASAYYPVKDQEAYAECDLPSLDAETLDLVDREEASQNGSNEVVPEQAGLTNDEAAAYQPANGVSFTPEEVRELPEGYILAIDTEPTAVEDGASIKINAVADLSSGGQRANLQAANQVPAAVVPKVMALAEVTSITSIQTHASGEQEKGLVWDDSYGKKYGNASLGCVKTGYFQATITLNDGKKEKVWLYCMEPDLTDAGDKKIPITSAKIVGVANDSLIAKIFYYGYGGPAWGKTINGINMKQGMLPMGRKRLYRRN